MTIRICIIVVLFVISIVSAWFSENSDTQNETAENESYYTQDDDMYDDSEEYNSANYYSDDTIAGYKSDTDNDTYSVTPSEKKLLILK